MFLVSFSNFRINLGIMNVDKSKILFYQKVYIPKYPVVAVFKTTHYKSTHIN